MADEDTGLGNESGGEGGGTATIEAAPETREGSLRVDRLPPWRVLLHNDDKSEMGQVVDTIMELTPLKRQEAILRMIEAHQTGLTLLLSTHREHAELLQEQFESKRLTVTIEPGE